MVQDVEIFVSLLSELLSDLKTDENESKLSNIAHNTKKLLEFLQEEEDYLYVQIILNRMIKLRDKYEKCGSSHLIMHTLIYEVFVIYSSKL